MQKPESLPEYTPEELEQNALRNLDEAINDFENMVAQGMTAEQIVNVFHDAVWKGLRTLRYPKPKAAEPWRVNEIGIAARARV